LSQSRHKHGDFFPEVHRAIAGHCGGNAVVGQEPSCRLRVLRSYQVDFTENAAGAQGKIVNMPDGHCHHIQLTDLLYPLKVSGAGRFVDSILRASI
jgi:hypothetical protein